MLLQGGLETLDKAVPVEGLGQVANRPGPKRLRTNALVGEGREENERHAVALGKQVGLQLDAAHTGHLDICNHTREVIEAVRPQELFGGCECIYDVPERPHQAVSRGAYGCIIVNDCDQGKFRQSSLSLTRRRGAHGVTVALTADCITDWDWKTIPRYKL
jgi:hypothetical protein